MIDAILNDEEFMQEYLNSFCGRLTAESLDLSFERPLPYTEHGIKFYNNFRAIKKSLEYLEQDKDIRINEMIDLAEMVNGPESFLRKGFRKTYVEVNGADWFPSEAEQIYNDINNLIGNYHLIWRDLEDVYEREAMFHINFIKIHPFEDGNGRTGRIILAHNLIKNNVAPVVIDEKEKQQYFDFITNDDYQGFAEFLRQRSLQEEKIISQLYEEKVDKKQK